MTPFDHAVMSADGILIKYLNDLGLDATRLNDGRQKIARRLAAHVLYNYLQMHSREMADIMTEHLRALRGG